MPHAYIKSKQAIFTLSQLHAELAGKFAEILVALRKRNGGAVVGEGAPARWQLKGASN